MILQSEHGTSCDLTAVFDIFQNWIVACGRDSEVSVKRGSHVTFGGGGSATAFEEESDGFVICVVGGLVTRI